MNGMFAQHGRDCKGKHAKALRNLKHDDRASAAFMKRARFKKCPRLLMRTRAFPNKKGANRFWFFFFVTLMASVTFSPSGNLVFRDEAEHINGLLNQVNEQSYSHLKRANHEAASVL